MYKNWINAVLGLAVVGIAFVDLSASTLTWTLVAVGAVIAINSLWGALTSIDQKSHNEKYQGQA